MKIDMTGRIAIVTGGRVKIGYYIATKLLSYGAKVLITSRFPKDALFKFQKDPDYENVDQCALKYIKKNRELFLRKCTRVNGPVPDESYKEIVDFVKKEYPHFYLNDRCSSDSEYGIGLIFRSPNGESYTFDATSCKKIGETFKQDPIVKPVYEVLNTIFGIVDKDVGECECKCHRK